MRIVRLVLFHQVKARDILSPPILLRGKYVASAVRGKLLVNENKVPGIYPHQPVVRLGLST